MPTSAITALATLTLGSTASTVTFSSIVGTYRDLMLVITPIATLGAGYYIRLNGDSAANYSYVSMYGNGSSALSVSGSDTGFVMTNSHNVPTTGGVVHKLNLMDYSATDKHKTALITQDLSTISTERMAARWANTAAVTSLVCVTWSQQFAAGSTFTLYGVSA